VPLYGWVAGVAFLLALALLVHLSLGWKNLLSPWGNIRPSVLAGAFALVLASYAVRTIRLQHYFDPATRGQFLRTFRIQLIHNLFNNFLPMRTGEASFPILMKQNYRVPFTRSIPGLVYLRLMDFHFLVLIGLLVLALGERREAWLLVVLFAPLPLLAFVAQNRFLELLDRQRETGSRSFERSGPGPSPPEVPARNVSRLGAVREKVTLLLRTSLEGFPVTSSLFWLIWLWTGVNWTVKLLVFGGILTAFSPMPFSHALLGSITGELSSVLPIHGVAGAGTYEAGIMLGLLPRELDVQAALAGAVNLHLFVLSASVLSGGLALLIPVRAPSDLRMPRPGESEGSGPASKPPASHGS
jgi:uncharacterized membrane protein YbhN (UPF0104 family)